MTNMKILVLNQGSSTIKCSLYVFSKLPNNLELPVWETYIEGTNISQKLSTKIKNSLYPLLSEKGIDCIGHRVVHGGKKYRKTIFIDAKVKKYISKLSYLAPSHNLVDVKGINILEKLFPNIPQIAVFDTSFHHTLPKKTTIYPGPYNWTKLGIQRYGFHGISFQYCSKRAAKILKRSPQKMIICHLGSGASLCALKNGVSIDTTMGFTPLEGLVMNTRSGTVDPGILLYLLETKKRTVKQLAQELYEKSGLLGLSGISSDMRNI
jgi:acetate kinase